MHSIRKHTSTYRRRCIHVNTNEPHALRALLWCEPGATSRLRLRQRSWRSPNMRPSFLPNFKHKSIERGFVNGQSSCSSNDPSSATLPRVRSRVPVAERRSRSTQASSAMEESMNADTWPPRTTSPVHAQLGVGRCEVGSRQRQLVVELHARKSAHITRTSPLPFNVAPMASPMAAQLQRRPRREDTSREEPRAPPTRCPNGPKAPPGGGGPKFSRNHIAAASSAIRDAPAQMGRGRSNRSAASGRSRAEATTTWCTAPPRSHHNASPTPPHRRRHPGLR